MAAALDDLDDSVGAWQKKVNDAFAARWQFEDGFDDRFREANEAARREAGKGPLAELYAFLDDLADTYLAVGSELRAEIRVLVGERRAVLGTMYDYIGHTVRFLHETGARVWLRRGLAGAAIEDARVDFRDLYLALGDLYLEARRAGLEPASEFRAVGALASKEPAGRSTAGILQGFEESAFFIADVRPKVGLDSWTF